jgi:hypothetical protein
MVAMMLMSVLVAGNWTEMVVKNVLSSPAWQEVKASL